MSFLPIVERELRVAARRPGFFWLRGLLALVAVVKGYELLNRYEASQVGAATTSGAVMRAAAQGLPLPLRPALTGADLLIELAWLMFGAVVLLGVLAADGINRERREGTLGLLLLTDLTPREIILGKMLSHGLTGFAALLGFMPIMASTVLVGGVSLTMALMTGVGLVADLLVMLAAGLWMSAVFRRRHYAMLGTLGLGLMLTYGPEIFGRAWLQAQAPPWLGVISLAGWAGKFSPSLALPLLPLWFILTGAVGWAFLRLAERALTENWQDSPHAHVRKAEPPQDWNLVWPKAAEANAPPPGSARVSWLTDPRPWDADPVRWRVERLGSPDGFVWLAALVAFLAQFGLLESLLDTQARAAGVWGVASVGGMLVMLGASAMLAWAGARFFHDAKGQQDLELLLTTPVGGRRILASQWQVLRRSLTLPFWVALALAAIGAIALVWSCLHGEYDRPWFLLPLITALANLALEMVALCWVGMRFGWLARNGITAVCWTVWVVQMVALPFAMVLAWGCLEWADRTSNRVWSQGFAAGSLAFVFLMAKNLALIVWARSSLRRELRLGRKASAEVQALHPLLQPA